MGVTPAGAGVPPAPLPRRRPRRTTARTSSSPAQARRPVGRPDHDRWTTRPRATHGSRRPVRAGELEKPVEDDSVTTEQLILFSSPCRLIPAVTAGLALLLAAPARAAGAEHGRADRAADPVGGWCTSRQRHPHGPGGRLPIGITPSPTADHDAAQLSLRRPLVRHRAGHPRRRRRRPDLRAVPTYMLLNMACPWPSWSATCSTCTWVSSAAAGLRAADAGRSASPSRA